MTETTMSNRGPLRVEIHVPIQFEGPLHVGTGERLSIVSDAPILRNADGLPYLPGASIRGVVRDWCEREASVLGVESDAVERLFGTAGTADAPGRQGRLTVFDVLLLNRTPETEPDIVRDHVAISREWGAAKPGGKFDLESAASGEAVLRFLYEGDNQGDKELVLLRSAIAALSEGLLPFGGKTGWGLGAVRIPKQKENGEKGKTPRWFICNRKDPDELEKYLWSRCARTNREDLKDVPAVESAAVGEAHEVPLDLDYSKPLPPGARRVPGLGCV